MYVSAAKKKYYLQFPVMTSLYSSKRYYRQPYRKQLSLYFQLLLDFSERENEITVVYNKYYELEVLSFPSSCKIQSQTECVNFGQMRCLFAYSSNSNKACYYILWSSVLPGHQYHDHDISFLPTTVVTLPTTVLSSKINTGQKNF